jgi:hypothetical protein
MNKSAQLQLADELGRAAAAHAAAAGAAAGEPLSHTQLMQWMTAYLQARLPGVVSVSWEAVLGAPLSAARGAEGHLPPVVRKVHSATGRLRRRWAGSSQPHAAPSPLPLAPRRRRVCANVPQCFFIAQADAVKALGQALTTFKKKHVRPGRVSKWPGE